MSKITKEKYEFALARIEELLPMVDANDRNAVELTMMSDVVIEYEKEHMSQNQVASMAYRNIVFDLGNVIVKLDEQATIKGFA